MPSDTIVYKNNWAVTYQTFETYFVLPFYRSTLFHFFTRKMNRTTLTSDSAADLDQNGK